MRSSFSLISIPLRFGFCRSSYALRNTNKSCTNQSHTFSLSMSLSSQIAEAFVLNEDCILIMISVCILLSTYLACMPFAKMCFHARGCFLFHDLQIRLNQCFFFTRCTRIALKDLCELVPVTLQCTTWCRAQLPGHLTVRSERVEKNQSIKERGKDGQKDKANMKE